MTITETKLNPATSAGPEAQFFNMKTPMLSEGMLTTVGAKTDLLSVAVKIYAAGGENALHAHPYEDHSFIVLSGQATFYIGAEENVRVVNPTEGVMLPKGLFYRFLSSSKENLVMLRVGAQKEKTEVGRIKPNGESFVTDTAEQKKQNNYIAPVVIPGKFHFG